MFCNPLGTFLPPYWQKNAVGLQKNAVGLQKNAVGLQKIAVGLQKFAKGQQKAPTSRGGWRILH